MIGRLLQRIAGVIARVGGALNGGRSADASAPKLSEQRRDDYRP